MSDATPSAPPDAPQVILPRVHDLGDGFQVRRALPSAMRRMVGPFVFFDQMGPVTLAPGTGQDVRPHPHIGLSTLTWLYDGEIRHRDSAGHVETIRAGEVNWMTAGRGIVHSERTPTESRAVGGRLFGQQIWIALPRSMEETTPGFTHHAAASLPRTEGDGIRATLVAGAALGLASPVPVFSDLMFVDLVLADGARFAVPKEHVERAIFVVSGAVAIAGQDGRFEAERLVVFAPGSEIVLEAHGATRLTLIGGEPFPEKRFVYWNFVSSSKDRIEAAKADWRAGRFPAVAGETEFIPLPDDPPGVVWKG
jgi:redox-sensitive bicupin YhaK (pirin superfamily)